MKWRRALRVAAWVLAAVAAIGGLGLASSQLSAGAARRVAVRLIERSYRQAVPERGTLLWLDPSRARAYPPPVTPARTFPSSLRTYLFAPRVFYTPEPAPGCPDNGPCDWAVGVARIPAPFIVRVHYQWFHLAAAPPPRGPRGLVEWGVVTNLALFGVAIPIDQEPRPR